MYFKVSLKFKQKVSNVVNSSDARYSIWLFLFTTSQFEVRSEWFRKSGEVDVL